MSNDDHDPEAMAVIQAKMNKYVQDYLRDLIEKADLTDAEKNLLSVIGRKLDRKELI